MDVKDTPVEARDNHKHGRALRTETTINQAMTSAWANG